MSIPAQLISRAKNHFDLTEAADQASVLSLAESLLDNAEVTLHDVTAAARAEAAPLEFRIAAKLYESRRWMMQNDQPVKLGVVFAMWGEQNRLRPKSAGNPNGEDALRVKLAQLAWATAGTPVEWTLYAVDDGCPYDSGVIAQEIANTHPLGQQARILFLADALPAGDGPLAKLASVNDSRKGGAIIYGAHQAITDANDAILYTDADNSVHLGQIGLLLRPYVEKNAKVVLGDRKHADAVLVKQASRWGIGIKVLRHMQRMVGSAIFSSAIKDTQAAFKLYDADLLQQIIADPTVYDFSFDTDWILALIASGQPFEQVPFAFIDSAAESASITQGPMTTWETLLKGLVKAVRKHNVPHNEAMARVLDQEIHSSTDLDLLINHLPPELVEATDADYGNPDVMSPEALQLWIQERKRAASHASE